jgi:hypothetical protein
LARQVTVRQAFVAGATSAIVALVISAPWLFIFLRESAAANAPFYDITHVSKWDASLNSFPIPNIDHPWLQSLARLLYRGPVNEPGQANLGFVASLLAILGAAAAWRNRYWWPVMICAGVGLALALGLTLKWDGVSLQWSGFRPVNTLLWQLGYALKPGFFTTNTPPAPFDNAVPMPGLWLSAIVPLWERSRVFARYALLGGLGIYLLAGRGIMRIPRPWARAIVVVVLIFEVMPPATKNVPFPPPSHPAFEFVKAQKMDTAGTIDLSAWQPDLLYMPIGGATLWETEYHGKPTVAGASSVWPAHVVVLDQWLQEHPHAFLHPDFVPLLRQYGVNLVIFHVTGGYAADMLDEARQNLGLQELRCFDPADTSGPWPYVICILRVQDEE